MENVTNENFDEKISTGKVIVDFWADWCGPCRMLSPLLEEIEKENEDIKVIKVNVDQEAELAQKYAIRSIPTIYFINNGEIKEKKIGLVSKQHILDTISTL